MSEQTITLSLEISDSFCAALMSTALEGGIGYWSEADKIEKRPHPEPMYEGDFEYVKATLHDAEGGDPPDFEPVVMDWDLIRRGIKLVLESPDFSALTRGNLLKALTVPNTGDLDADDADRIVQMGAFGKMVYG